MEFNKKIIEDTIANMKAITDNTFCFTGSISLRILGLIDRDIHDIDIVMLLDDKIKASHEFKELHKTFQDSIQVFFPGEAIDLFMITRGTICYYEYEYEGIKLNILDPYETIHIKTLSYQKKHLKDIGCITKVKDLNLGNPKYLKI